MAVKAEPPEGLTLHGVGDGRADSKTSSHAAVVLKLSDDIVDDVKKASSGRSRLQFEAGKTPKLHIGGRTIDLLLSKEAFCNELYTSTVGGSLSDLTFSGVISHRAVVNQRERRSQSQDTGTDEALAALRSSMASFEQEKQAKQANISGDVLPMPKSRFEAAKKNRRLLSGSGHTPLSGAATPPSGTALTSSGLSEAETRLQAMRTPIVHLLAMRSATMAEIATKTHIPKEELTNMLQKTAREVDGKWQLTDRAYKDLDVWKFGYTTKEDRQAAIDNAVRAYDRLRIGRDEKIWQKLLPQKDRGKGIMLSRLHLGARGGLTPNPAAASPMLRPEAALESQPASAANTPRLGASTPRTAASRPTDVMKRLLSKDPKKARAVEEARDKKRKDREAAREAAASDREGAKPAKRQQTAKSANPKIKSAEVVHSSDDESGEEGEVKDDGVSRVDSKLGNDAKKLAGVTANANRPATPSTPRKAAADPAKSIASLASKVGKASPAPSGKLTPRNATGLSAPDSQHKSQRSPRNSNSRPSVPSPLGAARPRGSSDVSDRPVNGQHRSLLSGGTPRSSGVPNGARKRQDTVTSTISGGSSSGSDQKPSQAMATHKQPKPEANGVSRVSTVNGITTAAVNGVKRKADNATPQQDTPKHRKTESLSSQSQQSLAASIAVTSSTPRTSPDGTFDTGSSSDSTASVIDTITYTQGVNLAEKFRDVYYPAYAVMYDAQAAKQAKGEKISKDERDRLWAMHNRLVQMKREIETASQREHQDD
ncbi:hypothetical protein BAUCODRAFT_375823 [Baudoinia panamericana UAMH 10762]|uniref:Uncharacterized protein n=1 Tax=Baudoinia panamericana (strain UAMH 10762) TaxID=717646 RepID=M2LVF2_BAUPA|nr:uncharacterized protein BAUCODRAFT_375823 [Baudoinia panamericana UAMH 10762]EMC98612.1 hypothetical protein BAUCODRAFT_375823 [Baudoinia panamericana UAMH 10762]